MKSWQGRPAVVGEDSARFLVCAVEGQWADPCPLRIKLDGDQGGSEGEAVLLKMRCVCVGVS